MAIIPTSGSRFTPISTNMYAMYVTPAKKPNITQKLFTNNCLSGNNKGKTATTPINKPTKMK